MSPRQGIVDLSLPLAAEPALGTYTIHVEGKTHSFSVEEYGVWGREVHGGWEPLLGMSPWPPSVFVLGVTAPLLPLFSTSAAQI